MDKIEKELSKLSPKEKENLKFILNKIKSGNFSGLDVKKLKGSNNLFRVRKGSMRIIYLKNEKDIILLKLERKNDHTYKN
jgi:mRNA-degrading endonuclease RelE of RelBE toxin-antitoxin system